VPQKLLSATRPFLLHFFGSAMPSLRDFELKLAFGGGEMQDFVSLKQMLNLLPNG